MSRSSHSFDEGDDVDVEGWRGCWQQFSDRIRLRNSSEKRQERYLIPLHNLLSVGWGFGHFYIVILSYYYEIIKNKNMILFYSY